MRRLLEEVRAYPFHYGVPLAGAVALLILVVQAWSEAPAQPPRPAVTVASAPRPAAEPAAEEPAGTLEDAAAKVDDGDYAGALVIAAALGKSQEGRIRREISRDLARRVNVALRAGD